MSISILYIYVHTYIYIIVYTHMITHVCIYAHITAATGIYPECRCLLSWATRFSSQHFEGPGQKFHSRYWGAVRNLEVDGPPGVCVENVFMKIGMGF